MIAAFLSLVVCPATVRAGGGEVLISFVGPQHGWVGFQTSTSTRLLGTSNGGRSWRVSKAPVDGIGVQFADRLHGWIVGEVPQCATTPPPACHSVLLGTADGGRTWHPQFTLTSGYDFGLNTLQAIDAKHVVVRVEKSEGCCSPTLLWSTSDGGRIWREHTAPGEVSDLHFVTPRDGWLSIGVPGACSSTIYVTHDGGRSFRPQLHLAHGCDTLLDFVSLREGWALASAMTGCQAGSCSGLVLYHTSSGGKRWSAVQAARGRGTMLSVSGIVRAMDFAPGGVGWITFEGIGVGLHSGLAYTLDGGRHWHLHTLTTDHQGISLVGARHGWLMGCYNGGSCHLYRSDDGGRTLHAVSLPP